MATKQPTTNSSTDENTELARKHTQEAADRTLMAWMSSSISFIAFGFGIAAIGQTLEKTAVARMVGMSFVVVAVFAVVLAMVASFLKKLSSPIFLRR